MKIGGKRLKLLREDRHSASRKFIVVCESGGLSIRPSSGDKTGGIASCTSASQIVPRLTSRLSAAGFSEVRLHAGSVSQRAHADRIGPNGSDGISLQAYRPRKSTATAQAVIIAYRGKTINARVNYKKFSIAPKRAEMTKLPPPMTKKRRPMKMTPPI